MKNTKKLFGFCLGGLLVAMVYVLLSNHPETGIVGNLTDSGSRDSSVSIAEKASEQKAQEKQDFQYTVPESEILDGGPPKDGIPPIDNPVFIDTTDASFLNDSDEGIAIVDEKNISYFFPFRILVWHEIVNMKISHDGRDDFPISVTYCPLCRTGVVYEAVVDGKDTTFGTSGKLWQSNLIMYDRQENIVDESLWSQVLGQAIGGKEAGNQLTIIRSTITDYKTWKSIHTDTKVLSTDTRIDRDYTADPYGPSYYSGKDIYFPVNFSDTETHPKELVLGLEVDGNYVAYKKDGWEKINDTFAGSNISIDRNTDGGFNLQVNGKQHPYTEGFWFSWKAAHPSAVLR